VLTVWAEDVWMQSVPPSIIWPSAAPSGEPQYLPSLVWYKVNNTVPAASDGTNTDGRLALGTSGKGDDGNIYDSGAYIGSDGVVRVYYRGQNGTYGNVTYLAESLPGDPLTLVKRNNTGVSGTQDYGAAGPGDGRMIKGPSGRMDDQDIIGTTPILWTNTLYLFSACRQSGIFRIHCATGTPYNLVKLYTVTPAATTGETTYGRVPLSPSGYGDVSRASYPMPIIGPTDVLYLFYSGSDGSNWRIYCATSSPAMWLTQTNTIRKINPAIPSATDTGPSSDGRLGLGTSGKGDSTHVICGDVVKLASNLYYMVYCGYDGSYWRAYSATSADLKVWYKVCNTTPPASDTSNTLGRIGLGASGKGDASLVYPYTMILTNDTLYLYYGGSDGTSWRTYCATQSLTRISP